MSDVPWQTHASRTAYQNHWIRVREDTVTRPDGEPGIYGVVEVRHDSVFVVALTAADEVVLVELYRYAVGKVSLEIPAGGSDPGEEPLAAARRELLEETGLVADEWEQIGRIDALIGICDAPEHVYLARGLHSAPGAEQTEEGISAVRRVPWLDVLALVRSGELSDGETVASLMLAALALGRVS